MRKYLTLALATIALNTAGFAGESDKKVAVPPEDSWQFKLSLPAWIPWMVGDTGVNGLISHVDLGPNNIIPRIDMAADVRAEAHKGRFSTMGEFMYMSLSDGIGTKTLVKKLDLRMDQTMGDIGVGWRLIESERGYLDVISGVRYTNLYQRQTLQANDQRIDALAGRLAVAGTALRTLLARELAVLAGKDPTVPIAPLDGDEAARLARRISRLKGSTAERQAKIEDLLHHSLNRVIARTDDWWDPYIGLRARYNLNAAFYLTAKGDVGGFCVGSDVSWTAEAALGIQITRNIFSEIGYRALGVDYDKDGLVVDTITHGPQLTVGINF